MRHAGVHRSGDNDQGDEEDDEDDAAVVVVGIVRTVYCEKPGFCWCVGLKFEERKRCHVVVRCYVKYFDG
ncbi:hypothetical protein EAF00_004760 [Botryotinia globosa]|nr:hypothetical protein EAF00_004760 [Botryotinia globosa]